MLKCCFLKKFTLVESFHANYKDRDVGSSLLKIKVILFAIVLH